MKPLHTRATITGDPAHGVLKVLALDEFLRSRYEPEECALWYEDTAALKRSRALDDLSWGAIYFRAERAQARTRDKQCTIESPHLPDVVAPGDVIRINDRNHLISVMHRRAARTNSLFVTERCNSYCVMCSQPPVDRDDSHRILELMEIVRLIDPSEEELGITGGEPTLLGDDLGRLLRTIRTHLPSTRVHLLTNGRRFADAPFASSMSAAANGSVMWAVPLYSDSPEVHDYVVQRRGAFKETLLGLLNLARLDQPIEIRCVLQRATVPRLRALAHFIYRNLNFVKHVAWMGLEPMGFARPNWEAIWVDPSDYVDDLAQAVSLLDNAGVRTSIYNLPLCVLPDRLRSFAAQSISDWKNDFLPECEQCDVRNQCAGFFSSVGRQHLPKGIHPLSARELRCQL